MGNIIGATAHIMRGNGSRTNVQAKGHTVMPMVTYILGNGLRTYRTAKAHTGTPTRMSMRGLICRASGMAWESSDMQTETYTTDIS